MLATIESKLIALAAVLLLILSAYAWAHHKGAESQKTADAVVIAQKNQALSAAGESLDNAAAALRTSSAATLANRAAWGIAIATADAAAQDARNAKAALLQANSDWQAKFKAAQNAKGCETLKELLCKSVMDY